MPTIITRRLLLGAAAGTALLPAFAHAADVPLPADVTTFGGAVQAMGPAPKPLRLAMLSFQGSSFWEAVDKGIVAGTAYLKPLNTTVDYVQLGTALTAEVIVAGIDGALAKQYDGIATIPIFDGTVGMGTQAYDAGKGAGQFIAKQLGGEGKIVVITGYLGAAQHKQRMDGALDLLKKEYPKITILGPFECKDDDAVAYSQATDAMTSNPDLKLIYVTAGGSEAVAKAVVDAKAIGRVGVVGYDDLPEKQKYKDNGAILALVDQAPSRQSFDSLVMLHNILAFKATYPSDVPIPAPIAYGKLATAKL